jgi:cytidylate kinase
MRGITSTLRYTGSVCIGGLTASGKTTHSHLLAGEFGLTYVSASQILLNAAGVSPIQAKDFWVTPPARALLSPEGYARIDEEILRIEQLGQGYMFDTVTMPWKHQKPALCIWLESDLRSRVLKSIVSHRGRGTLSKDEYDAKITAKDVETAELCHRLYDINVATDTSPFDLVLDIGPLIHEATLPASLESIRVAHSLIRPAVAWYLTGRDDFKDEFQSAVERCPDVVRSNSVVPAVENV